jgi:murein DD-endopeptidase MepM/ murein hydrolase activator NlpD
MASEHHISTPARQLAVLAVAALAALALPAPSHAAYGWPVKPFNRQHPVRGLFGDPRIGLDASGRTARQFHFGVDVSAPNGTPVYATISGTIVFIHPDAIAVRAAGGVEFSYWHIVPRVRAGAYVTAYRTVIGRVEKPWAHVHFSEARYGRYLNPLRKGGLTP